MRNYNFGKRKPWAYANYSVHENIQKNEFVKLIREKLMKKRLEQKSE